MHREKMILRLIQRFNPSQNIVNIPIEKLIFWKYVSNKTPSTHAKDKGNTKTIKKIKTLRLNSRWYKVEDSLCLSRKPSGSLLPSSAPDKSGEQDWQI